MKPGAYNISIYQGDSFALTLTLYQDAARTTPVDLTDFSASGDIKAAKSQATPDASFTCSVSDPSGGVIDVTLAPDETAALAAGRYYYDLQIANADDTEIDTVLAGIAVVTQEVTKAVAP